MPEKTERSDKPARTFLPQTYEEKPFVGTFRLVQGKHREGGNTYRAGQVFRSKSNLLEKNQAGAIKFEKVEETGRAARRPSRQIQEIEGQSDVVNAAPGGQVSTGFQETSGKGRYQTRTEPGDPTVTTPPQTIGERQMEDLKARAEGRESGDEKAAFGYTEEELYQMTVPDLKELAESEEVDLSGATRKDEIVERLKATKK